MSSNLIVSTMKEIKDQELRDWFCHHAAKKCDGKCESFENALWYQGLEVAKKDKHFAKLRKNYFKAKVALCNYIDYVADDCPEDLDEELK